ncbi:unnamed protein product [Amoebophrya sp. A120]|nr:unnamed protein product [Amoebophrya sp. A120]|eukprot:GSA120T00009120001.1
MRTSLQSITNQLWLAVGDCRQVRRARGHFPLGYEKITPKLLDSLMDAGSKIGEHEDALTTLSQGETWRDIHDLFSTKRGNVDLKDPEMLSDLHQINAETKAASDMFRDAYESVAGILKELHLTPDQTADYLRDSKIAAAEIFGEQAKSTGHTVEDQLQNMESATKMVEKFL